MMKSVFTPGMFTLDFGYTGDCSVKRLGPKTYKVKKNAIYYDKKQDACMFQNVSYFDKTQNACMFQNVSYFDKTQDACNFQNAMYYDKTQDACMFQNVSCHFCFLNSWE